MASLFEKLKNGMAKTRDGIVKSLKNTLKAFKKVDEELFESIEEILISADISVDTAMQISECVREKAIENKIKNPDEIISLVKDAMYEILKSGEESLNLYSPTVILVIGVNGAGKTTTVGKLAHKFTVEGKTVLIAAADTFRAAAIDQLSKWAERSGVKMLKHEEGADPGAVVFDAIQSAKSKHTDILICDTAGRLHNKKNLMAELEKINRIIDREYPEAARETWIVLDSTTGQNAFIQAKLFNEAAKASGIILTKLDGTAKGGVILSVCGELKIPVRYIGVGEGIDDLQAFDSKAFIDALFE